MLQQDAVDFECVCVEQLNEFLLGNPGAVELDHVVDLFLGPMPSRLLVKACPTGSLSVRQFGFRRDDNTISSGFYVKSHYFPPNCEWLRLDRRSVHFWELFLA